MIASDPDTLVQADQPVVLFLSICLYCHDT